MGVVRCHLDESNSNILYKKACPTNKQLSVELQAGVAIVRRFQEAQGELVHLQRRLLHVPLGSDVMPLLIVQRDVRLHRQDQWPASEIERERHRRWRWGGGAKSHNQR